jgi:hypothetical protein
MARRGAVRGPARSWTAWPGAGWWRREGPHHGRPRARRGAAACWPPGSRGGRRRR